MTEDAVRIVRRDDWGPELDLAPGGKCWPIIWPGMGAVQRSMHFFDLPNGVRTLPFRHPGEAVYYVLAGEVDVCDLSEDSRNRVTEGGMFHVAPGTEYLFAALGGPATVIGGPSPADPSIYSSIERTEGQGGSA